MINLLDFPNLSLEVCTAVTPEGSDWTVINPLTRCWGEGFSYPTAPEKLLVGNK